jgi:hypothetical protein
MAHVNTTGKHVSLWLENQTVLGLGNSNAHPIQESAFFGNIFVSPPKAYFCNGRDWDRAAVAGRLAGGPYVNPYGTNALCQNSCTTVGGAYGSCGSFTKVITVFRDLDPWNAYTVCNKLTGLCLDIHNNSTSTGGLIDVWPANGANNQKFYFERANIKDHDGNYRLRSKFNNLYVDIIGGVTTSGAGLNQWNNNGGNNQLWNLVQITQGSYLIENERSQLLMNATGLSAGQTVVQKGSGSYGDGQVWKITLSP